MYKKKIFITLILSLCTLCAVSQPPLRTRPAEKSEDSFFDRLYIGGGLGLQFGTYTYVEVSPIVGYKITDRFTAGLGMKYIYLKYDDDFNTYSTHLYGGGPFARFFIFEELFLHGELETLSMEVPDIYYRNYTRKNITSVFLGGGYRQMIGDRSSIDLLLLYNVNENKDSPYQNPIIRIGFGFGL